MNNWAFLFAAGILEIGFATFLKLSQGFTRNGFTIGFVVLAIGSFVFLSRAITTIPMGTAYAVWTGIGAFGTAIVGMYMFGEPVSVIRILLLTNLIGSIICLKLVS